MSTGSDLRAAVIAEARGWIGTPFHHRQRTRGRGVDCVNLLIAVYAAVGLVPEISLPWYPHDWHMHRDRELLIETLERYAYPVGAAGAGDVAVYGYGRSISHAAIVESAETVIHAYAVEGYVCRTERAALETRLAATWTKRTGKDEIASYWSIFPREAAAVSERIAA